MGDRDYEETVLVDWLKAVAIETRHSISHGNYDGMRQHIHYQNWDSVVSWTSRILVGGLEANVHSFKNILSNLVGKVLLTRFYENWSFHKNICQALH